MGGQATPKSGSAISQPGRSVPVKETRPSAVAGQQQRVAQTTATTSPMEIAAHKPPREPNYSEQVEREIANLIREIVQYNDHRLKSSERWLINQSTLKQLSTRNQSIIKRC